MKRFSRLSMVRCVRILFLCVLAAWAVFECSPARAGEPPALERVRRLTIHGLDQTYNFDFEKASKTFDEAIAAEPLYPRPHLSKTSILFWRYLMSREETELHLLLAQTDNVIETAEEYIDTFGKDADVLTCLGTVYAYRAFAYGRTKSYFKSAWDGKKSYDYFAEALDLDPRFYDAYAGIGVFHYFAAFLPKSLQWIVSILGISGDAALGMTQIRTAAEKGVFMKAEATYCLAQFLPWHSGDFDASEKLFAGLQKQYPGNTLLGFTLAVWEIRRNDVAAAKKRLLEVLDREIPAIPGIARYAHYKLAECYFRLGEFREARLQYGSFLAGYDEEVYRATSLFRIGLTYELAGGRDTALVFYRQAAAAERKFGDDAYSARRAELLGRAPLATIDSLLLLGNNALRSGEYARARTLLSLAKERAGRSSPVQPEITYRLGETMFEQERFEEALRYFREVLDMTISSEERWLRPWSHFQAGLCLVKLDRTADAKKEFEQVQRHDDYDFDNWLSFRTGREIDRVK